MVGAAEPTLDASAPSRERLSVYLDHHAATPPSEAVVAAMAQAARLCWANPSSVHAVGRRARSLLEEARRAAARSLGCETASLVWTSGGTEACNLGLRSVAEGVRALVSTAVEHPAVSEVVEHLVAEGAASTVLPMEGGRFPEARVLAATLERCARPAAVVLQAANHETGTLPPMRDWLTVAKQYGARVFVDASQAWGKVPLQLDDMGADMVALAPNKMGGPPGVGLLYASRSADVLPQILGGSQERGRRGGTPALPLVVGVGQAACELDRRLNAQSRVGALRDAFEAAALSCAMGSEMLACGRPARVAVNGAEGPRLASCANLSFDGARSDRLVAALDLEGVECSAGAACSSGLTESSPVIAAMYPEEPWRAAGCVRFSFGPSTTEAEVDAAIRSLRRVVGRYPWGGA